MVIEKASELTKFGKALRYGKYGLRKDKSEGRKYIEAGARLDCPEAVGLYVDRLQKHNEEIDEGWWSAVKEAADAGDFLSKRLYACYSLEYGKGFSDYLYYLRQSVGCSRDCPKQPELSDLNFIVKEFSRTLYIKEVGDLLVELFFKYLENAADDNEIKNQQLERFFGILMQHKQLFVFNESLKRDKLWYMLSREDVQQKWPSAIVLLKTALERGYVRFIDVGTGAEEKGCYCGASLAVDDPKQPQTILMKLRAIYEKANAVAVGYVNDRGSDEDVKRINKVCFLLDYANTHIYIMRTEGAMRSVMESELESLEHVPALEGGIPAVLSDDLIAELIGQSRSTEDMRVWLINWNYPLYNSSRGRRELIYDSTLFASGVERLIKTFQLSPRCPSLYASAPLARRNQMLVRARSASAVSYGNRLPLGWRQASQAALSRWQSLHFIDTGVNKVVPLQNFSEGWRIVIWMIQMELEKVLQVEKSFTHYIHSLITSCLDPYLRGSDILYPCQEAISNG